MNLIIDQGNTNIKFFIFSGNKIKKKFIFTIKKNNFNFLSDFFIRNIIYCTVSDYKKNILEIFSTKKIFFFSSASAIPIINNYTSKSIGLDRLASACGASFLFPHQNILCIDIGSAITFDFINKDNEFSGGNISPGLKLRYKSLNNYTVNLPLLEPKNNNIFFANNTTEAIIAGVQNGVLFEIEGYINQLIEKNTDFKIILTGGDAFFFEKKIKYPIFAEPNLVAIGLNQILKLNTK